MMPVDTNQSRRSMRQSSCPQLYLGCSKCRIVRVNVSGAIFMTHICTFSRIPDSLLGNPSERMTLWDRRRKEYYLDRHRPSFEAIFQFYQSGILRCPADVPVHTFIEELEFFKFKPHVINNVKKSHGILVGQDHVTSGSTSWERSEVRRKIWRFLDDPTSSKASKAFQGISVFFVAISIMSFCFETIPQFRIAQCQAEVVNSNTTEVTTSVYTHPCFILETICTIFFLAEYSVGLFAAPRRLGFIIELSNIVDLVAAIPYFIFLALSFVAEGCELAKKSPAIMCLRILRVFRIFRLSKHYRGFQILLLSLMESFSELSIFVSFIVVGSMIFGSALYFAELECENQAEWSIPQGMWLATVTMTSVGYGDYVPYSVSGKLVGTTCAIVGVLLIALPAPMIVANFNKYYKGDTGRGMRDEF